MYETRPKTYDALKPAPMIGIVGGIGPLAGSDLYIRVLENTEAHADQDHVPVLLASIPNEIVDRTDYLLGKVAENPAAALAKVALLLENAGATHIGIACNTAHAPAIFDPMMAILREKGANSEIVNLIDETVRAIQTHPAQCKRVGLLCTSGSYKVGLYQTKLEAAGLEATVLDFARHDALVHDAVYNPTHGLKAVPKASPEAVAQLNSAIVYLKVLGAEAILLGCTEIGMVESELDVQNLPVFNPNTILARALVGKAFPGKLYCGSGYLDKG